jgi:hypothetical protein
MSSVPGNKEFKSFEELAKWLEQFEGVEILSYNPGTPVETDIIDQGETIKFDKVINHGKS